VTFNSFPLFSIFQFKPVNSYLKPSIIFNIPLLIENILNFKVLVIGTADLVVELDIELEILLLLLLLELVRLILILFWFSLFVIVIVIVIVFVFVFVFDKGLE
jgi:hypothetical protein